MDTKALYYTDSHEWIEPEGDERAVGISDHAQQMMGDIVFVDIPQVGTQLQKGDEILVIESPKAASSIYAPVSGEIVAVNEDLESSPEKINEAPYEGGWIVKIRPTDFEGERDSLLDYEAYQKKVEEE